MSTSIATKQTVDNTKIGECAAMQPLSGIDRVDETCAVLGAGQGGFVRKEEAGKKKESR